MGTPNKLYMLVCSEEHDIRGGGWGGGAGGKLSEASTRANTPAGLDTYSAVFIGLELGSIVGSHSSDDG